MIAPQRQTYVETAANEDRSTCRDGNWFCGSRKILTTEGLLEEKGREEKLQTNKPTAAAELQISSSPKRTTIARFRKSQHNGPFVLVVSGGDREGGTKPVSEQQEKEGMDDMIMMMGPVKTFYDTPRNHFLLQFFFNSSSSPPSRRCDVF